MLITLLAYFINESLKTAFKNLDEETSKTLKENNSTHRVHRFLNWRRDLGALSDIS